MKEELGNFVNEEEAEEAGKVTTGVSVIVLQKILVDWPETWSVLDVVLREDVT